MKTCQKCHAEFDEKNTTCPNCGEAYPLKKEKSNEKNELKGIKGWLILVGIGVVLSPFRLLFDLSQIYLPLFQDGTWEQLTSPSSEGYNSAFSLLLVGELLFNLMIIVASFYLIYLFFAKKASFPKLYIILMLLTMIFIPLDALLISTLFPDIEVFDPDTMREILRSIIVGLIWIPYMLLSKRVKATFVN